MLENKRFPAAMEKFQNDMWRKPAEKFKSLGHPIRLWITWQLLDREHCVGEFVEQTGMDYSTISQHLTILRQNGIVTDEKRGKEVFYSLNCDCVRKFLECVAEHRKNKTCGE